VIKRLTRHFPFGFMRGVKLKKIIRKLSPIAIVLLFIATMLVSVAQPYQVKADISKLIGTDIQCSVSSASAYIEMTTFQCSVSGNVTEIHVYSNASGNVKVGIYADNSGSPAELLNANNAGYLTSIGWNTVSIPLTPVTSGTNYWLAIITDTVGAHVQNNAGGTGKYKAQAYANGLPNPAGTGYTNSNGTLLLSLAGYGETSATPPPPPPSTNKSIVGTTPNSAGWAVNYPFQRKVFYMDGLFWVFYENGGQFVYKTSSDGLSWSSASFLRSDSGYIGHRMGLWFDGAYLHYAFCGAGEQVNSVYYCRLTPNANGTLVSSGEQAIYTSTYPQFAWYPSIIVDSNGCPWVSFALIDRPANASYAVVMKSSSSNGVWVTATGFPYTLTATSNMSTQESTATVGIPLTNGKVFYTYNKGVLNDVIYGQLWNGSWSTEEPCSTSYARGLSQNMVADGDDIHLVFTKQSADDIIYKKRTYGVGLGAEFTVQLGGTGLLNDLPITKTGTNSLVVYWLGMPTANHIYYREMINGIWADVVDWQDESASTIPLYWSALPQFPDTYFISFNSLLVSPPTGNIKFALVYPSGANSPYNVNFAFKTVDNIPPPPENITLPVQTTVSPQWSGNFNDNGIFAGSTSRSYRYSIVNLGSTASVFAITSDMAFYQTCLQVSVDNINWTTVGNGWQTTTIQPSESYPVWFRVNISLGIMPAMYSGNIIFSANQ
jgi:hypothetical protein